MRGSIADFSSRLPLATTSEFSRALADRLLNAQGVARSGQQTTLVHTFGARRAIAWWRRREREPTPESFPRPRRFCDYSTTRRK
jgi:hypothetical protein